LLGPNQILSEFAGTLQKLAATFELHDFGSYPVRIGAALRGQLREARYEQLLDVPGDGVVDIGALLLNYLDGARGRGMKLRCNSGVRVITREAEGWRVACDGPSFAARAVINAAGPWADEVARSAGLASQGLVSKRRHLYWTESRAGLDADAPYVWDTQGEWYFRPEAGGLLLCGGDEEPHPAVEPQVDPAMAGRLREKL
jgi:D-arginine dehydrogenase